MLKLKPGLLVALSTRVEGGVEYRVTQEGTHLDGAGVEHATWRTHRITTDPAEHKAACEVRSKVRNTIRGACALTPFGLVCALEDEGLLREKVVVAQALCDTFNGTAKHSRVKFATLSGKIAESEAEAVAAVRAECSALLADLDAVTRAGDVESIRDVSKRATQMARLLEQQTEARTALDFAVKAARQVASLVVKKVEKDGEDLAAVLAQVRLAPIATARLVFDRDDMIEPPGPGLPAIATGRLAGLAAAELMQEVAGPPEEDFPSAEDWPDSVVEEVLP